MGEEDLRTTFVKGLFFNKNEETPRIVSKTLLVWRS